MPGTPESVTYLIVDGENIDATLGNSVLDRRPAPAERPRWERLREFAQDTWEQPVKGLFFLNASGGALPMPFIRALLSMGYRPIALAGAPDQKVVDIGIQRTLEAIARRDGNVLLASHDGDFLPQIEPLLGGERQVGVVGFKEFLNAGFSDLPGLQIFDIEEDAGCFTSVLPRVRIIELDQFDPERFL
ncbi:nuclease [Actinoplanes sp. NPDC049596]|uniref:nuclease n=1 Tax=unclassified Actinoplanes TaxID=2626549 RepID=UPI003440E2D2